ncbi:WAT1-related protein [Senna tora]|uniref:WAT1-related protein n=1 Tax=Senna tora TaxID=362788 RepID=A0A834SG10_9FABA|nr:WAT1-related protein [Senna tora]
MVARRMSCYKDVVPFCAMIAVECTNVVVNVLFKAASLKGLSFYVFIVYSFAVSTLLLLLLLPFVFFRRYVCIDPSIRAQCTSGYWSRGLPSFKMSLLLRILPLGVIGFVAQLCGYKALQYVSPTLFSALSNLMPAFTFILAVFFRMERAEMKSSSTKAKIMGSVVSITDACDKGISSRDDSGISVQPVWDSCICTSLFNGRNKLECLEDKGRYNFGSYYILGLSSLVHTWGLHLKGPVYVSIFKPLSIAIAAAMSVIFLGDSLHLGR